MLINNVIKFMRGISPEFCAKVKMARRERGLSQSEIAAEMGCKQSAISMFEQGDPTKLNDEVVERLAAKFSLKIEKCEEKTISAPVSSVYAAGVGFCPNRQCPSNTPYQVSGVGYFLPDRRRADPAGGRFCALCGEILEKKCTNCGVAVHDGAVCTFCGKPYVV